jgi:formylmethanofuran dehydrogenase subunit D
MKIGKKTNSNPGYIWVPYIMTQSIATVSESDFKPRGLASGYVQTVASRYGTIILSKSQSRVEKAKKILEKIEDLKNKIITY